MLNQTHPYNLIFIDQGDIRVIVPTGNPVIVQQHSQFLHPPYNKNYLFTIVASDSFIMYDSSHR
jgi:hypothetical protein